MFVGCSEIICYIGVVVKHVQHIGNYQSFLSAWGGDLLGFSVSWGTEKIDGLWFARWGDQYPGWHCFLISFHMNLKTEWKTFYYLYHKWNYRLLKKKLRKPLKFTIWGNLISMQRLFIWPYHQSLNLYLF